MGGIPLQNCTSYAGFTQILPVAAEGTAFPNSPSALMTGRLKHVELSGCRSCSPHSLLRSVWIMFIQAAPS